MAIFNRGLAESVSSTDGLTRTQTIGRGVVESVSVTSTVAKSETTGTPQLGIDITAALRTKYEALVGVGIDPTRSFDETRRKYFIVRSGALEDSDTPTTFYIHTTFDNLGLAEGSLDSRERDMFILESLATTADPWSAAAREWALT